MLTFGSMYNESSLRLTTMPHIRVGVFVSLGRPLHWWEFRRSNHELFVTVVIQRHSMAATFGLLWNSLWAINLFLIVYSGLRRLVG